MDSKRIAIVGAGSHNATAIASALLAAHAGGCEVVLIDDVTAAGAMVRTVDTDIYEEVAATILAAMPTDAAPARLGRAVARSATLAAHYGAGSGTTLRTIANSAVIAAPYGAIPAPQPVPLAVQAAAEQIRTQYQQGVITGTEARARLRELVAENAHLAPARDRDALLAAQTKRQRRAMRNLSVMAAR